MKMSQTETVFSSCHSPVIPPSLSTIFGSTTCVNVTPTLFYSHSLTPQGGDPISQLFLCHRLNLSHNEVLQLPPHSFNQIKICTACKSRPPVYALLLIKCFSQSTSMFRVIVLHEPVVRSLKALSINGTRKFFNICTYNGASIVLSKMQIFVASLLEIPAQTWTFSACLATGLKFVFWPIFTLMVWQCLFSCTDDSTVQITLSKSSQFSIHILANSNLFCLLVSDIMGPYLALTTAHCTETRRYLRMEAALCQRRTFALPASAIWLKSSRCLPPVATPDTPKFC